MDNLTQKKEKTINHQCIICENEDCECGARIAEDCTSCDMCREDELFFEDSEDD